MPKGKVNSVFYFSVAPSLAQPHTWIPLTKGQGAFKHDGLSWNRRFCSRPLSSAESTSSAQALVIFHSSPQLKKERQNLLEEPHEDGKGITHRREAGAAYKEWVTLGLASSVHFP